MKWLTVTAAVFVSYIITFYDPKILAENTFLIELASGEIVAILALFLTVSMAAVTSIHFTLSKIKVELKERGLSIDEKIEDARKELTSNAWYLFGSFCLLLLLLLVNGSVSNLYLTSTFHGGVIVIVVFNLVVLYDLYSSAYTLTSRDY